MNDTYKKLFIGFLLVMIDINLGSFDILPDVIGYLMIFFGLGELYLQTKERAFATAKIFAAVMIVSAVSEIGKVTFNLIHMEPLPTYLVMLIGALSEFMLVIFTYQGMTAHMKSLGESVLYNQFAIENKRYVLIQGIGLIAMSFTLNIPKNMTSVYLIALVVIGIIMHIRLLINLDAAKNVFEIESSEMMEE